MCTLSEDRTFFMAPVLKSLIRLQNRDAGPSSLASHFEGLSNKVFYMLMSTLAEVKD